MFYISGNEKAFDSLLETNWNYFRFPNPIDKPSSLLDELKWLEAAGFVEVDVFWLQAGHAIFGGWKRE